MLCRSWKITDVQFVEGTDGLSAVDQKKMIHALTHNFNFQFRPDSVYVVVKDQDSSYGRWIPYFEKKQIVNVINGDTSVTDIISLSRKQFVFVPQQSAHAVKEIVCIPAK